MEFKNFLQSGKTRKVLYGIGVFLAVLIVFQAGLLVGYRKAAFSGRLGDNYYRAFDGERGGNPVMPMMMGGFPNTHGATGRIASIHLPTFVIEDRDNIEKVVLMNADTQVMKFRGVASTSDIRVGDYVVVIGSPNQDAQIAARIVRLLPPPPTAAPQTSPAGTGTPQ